MPIPKGFSKKQRKKLRSCEKKLKKLGPKRFPICIKAIKKKKR